MVEFKLLRTLRCLRLTLAVLHYLVYHQNNHPPFCFAQDHNSEMSDFWAGILLGAGLGFPVGVFVNKVTDWFRRWEAYKIADQLVGKWTAHNMLDGRMVDRGKKMDGAGDTIISHKSRRWGADSHVLSVESLDISDGRHHGGPLVIDPVFPRLATRIVAYAAPEDEVVKQQIVISNDFKTLYIFPDKNVATLRPHGYGDVHALCKVEGR